ncbi:DUF4232 domain-containing protein [Streptomyces sp. NRRL F-5123]|uniref:DUF4232 domain-containing protein n=1 Tax=Streptomyces sp. NRRL F-5123 TaxID=1463856 RepID=UPI0004E1AE84|nr:DUF4232 domain-containing protein [Streptomyces sp. NRRL F-5123]
MNRRLRAAALAAATALGAGLLMSACGGDDSSSSAKDPSPSATSSSPSAPAASATASPSTGTAAPADDSSDSTSKPGKPAKSGTDDSGSAPQKKGYGQSCGSNDISWSVTSESQAGGYFLVKATAKPGITCVIPAALPVIAFGSDGTEAKPAEQSAGQPITLKAGVSAYAGVNPKSTASDGGKELTTIIVSVSDTDPNPVSLKVGTYTVDKPIVTSWHTKASDAVPFAS